MSIQRQISVVLLAVVGVFGGLSYSLFATQLMPAFQSLEIEAAISNRARVESALDYDVQQLAQKCVDWATWDNSYRFVLGQDENYIANNLGVSTFEQQDVDLVMFLDVDNELQWGMLFDHETYDRKLLDELKIREPARSAILTHESTESFTEGFISTRFGPMIISSRPIIRNNGVGPVAGTLLFGQLMNAERLTALRDRTEVHLAFLDMEDPEYLRVKHDSMNVQSETLWQVETEDSRIDYVEMLDLAGDPLHILRVLTPRSISGLGSRSLKGTLLSLAILTCFASIVIWILLRRIVIHPLTSLTRHVTQLQKTGDMSSRFEYEKLGEVGELALAFSKMQNTLLEREVKVRESVLRLEHQATHDALTGLANRRALHHELEQLSSPESSMDAKYCVCVLDLDRFKVVNDTSGHAAGDALLVQVATLIVECVYTTDTVVRLGGDEFALILYDCTGSVATSICERIRERIEALSFCWDDDQHRIGVSIGILSVSTSAGNASDILQRADAACFTAKEGGRNQVHLVEDVEPMVDVKRKELHWVQRISTAIDQDQFILFTQAIVPLQDTSGAAPERLEVLVRLRNYSTNKLLPPGAFLPSAERYKLSAKIDHWVIEKMVRYSRIYEEVFGDDRMYWINLSGASLSDDNFISFLEAAVKNSGLPPGRLNFEITESFAIRNVVEVSACMQRLKALGCQFALDDFGAGFSSFNYLQTLPIDCVKIDGLIVRKILESKVDRMFVKSIIDIARTMDIVTVAEFIEDDKLASEVAALGADFGQGFALGRPQEIMPTQIQAVGEHRA